MAKSKEDLVEEFRVQSIQEAALRVIARKGFEAATMQEIAEEAGVAKGTIYLYFANREELFEKTSEFALVQLDARIEDALASEERFDRRLRLLLQSVMEFFDENHEFFRVLLEVRKLGVLRFDPATCRTDEAHYHRHLEDFARFLERGMREGKVREVEPSRLALFLSEAINAVIMRRIAEEAPPPVSDDVEWITSVILDGISKKRSRA